MEQLEQRLELPFECTHEFETVQDTHKVVYVGYVKLNFQGLYLWGVGSLTKYELTPPRDHKIKIWQMEMHNNRTFLSSEGHLLHTSSAYWYRDELKGQAANQGILLTDYLLDAVFGKIDEHCIKLYRAVHGSSGATK